MKRSGGRVAPEPAQKTVEYAVLDADNGFWYPLPSLERATAMAGEVERWQAVQREVGPWVPVSDDFGGSS